MKSTCRPLALAFLVNVACTSGADQPSGYTKVSPADIPGAKVEVLEPLRLTDKARFPQNDPAYKSVEVFKDKLIFHYSAKPTIELAPDHVVAGGDTLGYCARSRRSTS